MPIIIFLVILVILILAHEFGHFLIAKRAGIRVDEFGIGFPPKLFGWKKGETEYTLNALPFGGFVKIFGENPDEESISGPDSKRSFITQSKYIQGAVVVAGVFFNILLAWILISFGFMSGLPIPLATAPEGAIVKSQGIIITHIEADTPAEKAGLKIGDRITEFRSAGTLLEPRTIPMIQEFIGAHGGEEVFLTYARGKEEAVVSLVPVTGILSDQPAIGIAMDTIGIVSLPPHLAIWEAGKTTVFLTGAVIKGFAVLISDAVTGEADLSALTGPVGIVGLVGDAASLGFVYLLGFTAFISINLAVINLLPFPALDGGRLLFVIIETIKGSPINPKIANTANMVGFVLLIILMVVVTANDVIRIVSG